MSSEWNVVWDGWTTDRWVWDRGCTHVGRSSVVFFFLSEQVRIQPRSWGKIFFLFSFCFLAKINFFLKEELGKKGFFV